MFDAVKEFDELVLASIGIFCRLRTVVSIRGCRTEPCYTPTERRMPIPVNIAFAGGNA
jgi:hypothetical protein